MTASLAFIFPGQGSQSVGMLADLASANDTIRATFDEASVGAGVDLWALSQDGPEDQLNRTEFTQPALLAASVALWRLWQARGGATPLALAGHSLGEYSALVAADALDLADAARLVRLRGQLMQAAVPVGVGLMVAVLGADDAVIEAACAEAAQHGVVVPANYNTPGQVVIGGDVAAVERAVALLAERGVRKAVRLAVSVPSHTPMMREASHRLAEAMTRVTWRSPRIPVVQNADAAVHSDVETVVDALVRQLHRPVLWSRCVQDLAARGVGRLAECGPGKALTGMSKRIDKGLEAKALGSQPDFEAALAEWSA